MKKSFILVLALLCPPATTLARLFSNQRLPKTCMLVLLVVSQLTVQAFQPDDATLERAVDAILAGYAGPDRPGAAIGIISDGKLVFHKGYGMADLQAQKANGSRVVYNIASGSKRFTAAVVATLVQQNKLAFTTNIRHYLPELPDYGRVITIENLLYHTSGIRDYMVLMWLTGKSFEAPFTNVDALNLIARQSKLNFNPGDRCVYSNSNYLLLAEIVRRVTGTSLAEYANQNLLEKLGMHTSGFGGYKIDENMVTAVSYRKSGDDYLPYANAFAAYGDGGMHTTLEDLLRWDDEFYNDSSPVQQILQPGKLANGNPLSYGMGIMFSHYRNEAIQSHPGAFLGFRSEILRFPAKRISIICLANSEDIQPDAITRAIADVYVFGDTLTGTQPTPASEAVQMISAGQAAALTGVYEVAPQVQVHIRYDDGLLSGQVTGQPRQLLYVDSTNSFSIGTTSDKAVFRQLVDGRFQQLAVLQQQGATIARRLAVIAQADHNRFAGSYYSEEQKTVYDFFSRAGNLWMKVGTNPEVKVDVLRQYNRIYFNYKNLEQAAIEFNTDSNGRATGFTLSSGRVSGTEFLRR